MISIDIETIPNKNLIECLPEPEYKYGNTKDEEKRKVIEEEARKKQIDRMALDPFLGRICSCAWDGDIHTFSVIDEISDAAEIVLINKILESLRFVMSNKPHVITWNGYDFDIPFIYKRAIVLNIPLPHDCPPLKAFRTRYTSNPHCDLKQELSGWDRNNFMSLDTASRLLLGEGKLDHDFSKFIELIETGNGNEIGVYNLNDAELTMKLYKKCEGILF